MVGLILAYPALMARRSPGPAAAAPVLLADAVLIAGLLGAYRARRGLLAAREALALEPRPAPAASHFAHAAPAFRREAHTH